MYVTAMTVTPEQAKAWLATQPVNRTLRWTRIKRYARLMSLGAWRADSNEAIGISDDGLLTDGQHRCHAVVMHGQPVQMVVMFGANTHVGDVLTRTAKDIMKILHGVDVSNHESTITNALYHNWTKGSGSTYVDTLDLYQRHHAAVSFASELLPHKKFLGVASVGSALAHAYYHEDHQRLREFMRIYSTGLYASTEDNAAFLFRRFMTERTMALNVSTQRGDVYYRAEYAMRAFCARKAISQIRAASAELYPLPETVPMELPCAIPA